jgi:RNA polymerase sigma-70 factor (ECF subfamily)
VKGPSVEGEDGNDTSLTLLERVKKDDPSAWHRLVELYGPVVFRWCLKAGLKSDDAADVGQDAFAVVSRKIVAFRHDRPGDSFRGWLYTIVHHKIVDLARTRILVIDPEKIERLASEPVNQNDDSSAWDDKRILVRRAVEMVKGEFESKTWEAFWRTVVENQAIEKVSDDLCMTREAVYIARSRVRKRFLREFGDLLDLDAGENHSCQTKHIPEKSASTPKTLPNC